MVDSQTGTTIRSGGITGTGIKIIALVAMLIDHIGAYILDFFLAYNVPEYANYNPNSYSDVNSLLDGEYAAVYIIMNVFRLIGRFAYPLFVFLLIEGFIHTRSVKKYALNLLIFVFISQIPYSLATKGVLLRFDKWNIFATLLMGLLCIWSISKFAEKRDGIGRIVFTAIPIIVIAIISYFIPAEYGVYGVMAIVIMYLLRRNRITGFGLGVFALCIYNISEITAFLMIPVIRMYNGKRGMKINKYFFYFFYPVHITILYVITLMLGWTTFRII